MVKLKQWDKIFLFGSIIFLLFACRENEIKSGICLSFDDNYLEQWVQILPLLDQYDAKVTFFLTGVGKLTEQEKIWLKQIQEEGHEIGAHGELHVSAHSYIQEHGFRRFWRDEIEANVRELENLGIYPRVFAYPYGERHNLMDLLLWTKFKGTRNVVGISSPSENLEKSVLKSHSSFYYKSLSIDRGELLSLEQISSLVDKAQKEQKTLFLHAHDIGSKGHYQVAYERLDSLLKIGKARRLDFITFSDI